MTKRTCIVDGCERPHLCKGLCSPHYQRLRDKGTTDGPLPRPPKVRTCVVEGCEEPLRPPHGRGMCGPHYKKFARHGDPLYTRELKVGVAECAVDGCSEYVSAREWCIKHYTRWQRHGSPTARLRGEVVDGKRICPRCQEDKPLSEWGTASWCRACVNAYGADRRRKNPRPRRLPLDCICSYCGAAFKGSKRQYRYCSTECAEANRHRANWPYLTARRARLAGATVEQFDRLEVFERDGWVCGICGGAVDPGVAWPDPMSASLDHIIPISRGGKHSRANAQCSHLGCNVRKGKSVA